MKKFVLLFCCVISMAFVSAQEIVYVGRIGSQDLKLFITTVDGEDAVSAYYYPDSNSEMLQLKGRLNDDGILLEQTQSSSAEKKVSFEGKFDDILTMAKPVFKGIWSDGETLKDFEITKLVEYANISFAQGEYISAREIYPLFLDSHYSPLNEFFQDRAMKEQAGFFKEGQEILIGGEAFNFWEQDCITSLSYFTASFASAFKSCYSYTGGAHPNQGFESFNLVVNNSEIRELSLDEFFKPGSDYESILSDYLVSSLKEQNASDIISGEISSFTIDDMAVFNVVHEGLRFSFQPYEVASYVEGSFFVDIPLMVFKDLIDPKGPLSFFID